MTVSCYTDDEDNTWPTYAVIPYSINRYHEHVKKSGKDVVFYI